MYIWTDTARSLPGVLIRVEAFRPWEGMILLFQPSTRCGEKRVKSKCFLHARILPLSSVQAFRGVARRPSSKQIMKSEQIFRTLRGIARLHFYPARTHECARSCCTSSVGVRRAT